jgi:PTH1 family peptidyl-tRNA hydrolase
VALPLDKIRLRPAGSAGGHNGLKDIQSVLATDKYPKLRFGIGNSYPKGMQADFVLGKWLKAEEPVVLLKIEKCIDIIESFIATGIDQTMSTFNNLSFTV